MTEEMKNLKKEQEETFRKLVQLDVNEHTEKKNDLTYLSWAWAWQAFKMICPDATYKVKQFADKDGVLRCYQFDPDLGYMVFTEVTACGLTYEMWLPAMDGANKAMKREPYSYVVGRGQNQFEKKVEAATMFDINKTIMRCLTKNLAMFGLGLYIYAGEDLPVEISEPATALQITKMRELKVIEPNICKKFQVEKLEDLTFKQADFIINAKLKELEKQAKGE